METVLKLSKVVTNSDRSIASINEYNHEYIDRLFDITPQVKQDTPEVNQTTKSIEYISQDLEVDKDNLSNPSNKYKNILDSL
jgi:hypothetical protein